MSTRTEGVCIGKPLPENTSRDSVLDSQETSQETNSKLIPNILNKDAHPAVGKPLLIGLVSFGQGGKGEISSVLSRSISDKPASGKPMLVDLERSESVSNKLASGKPMLVTQQTNTDSEYTQKSVPKCEKTRQKVQSLALKRGIRVIESKWVQNILEGSQTRLYAGNRWL